MPEGDCCSHVVVLLDVEKMQDGFVRDRWACKDCGRVFTPEHWTSTTTEEAMNHHDLPSHREIEESLRARIAELESMVVWAVRKGACVGFSGAFLAIDSEVGVIRFDGTDADILRAVREAMK